MMVVIPMYTVGATLADGAPFRLLVQKPDLEAVVRTLVESAASVITITSRPGPAQSGAGTTVTVIGGLTSRTTPEQSSLPPGTFPDVRGY